jgi:hypothetical protein
MKYIKHFENSSVIQQPFFLRNDRLFISEDIAKSISKFTVNINDKNIIYTEYVIRKNYDFYNKVKNENGRIPNEAYTDDFYVRYKGGYRMNIIIHRNHTAYDNEYGHFEYYIGGNSGDYSMHGANMIRATRDCNLNVMIKIYPIVEFIKDFYKKMKNGEKFLDILKNAIKKDNSIVKYGPPHELIDDEDIGYLIGSYIYNL